MTPASRSEHAVKASARPHLSRPAIEENAQGKFLVVAQEWQGVLSTAEPDFNLRWVGGHGHQSPVHASLSEPHEPHHPRVGTASWWRGEVDEEWSRARIHLTVKAKGKGQSITSLTRAVEALITPHKHYKPVRAP